MTGSHTQQEFQVPSHCINTNNPHKTTSHFQPVSSFILFTNIIIKRYCLNMKLRLLSDVELVIFCFYILLVGLIHYTA